MAKQVITLGPVDNDGTGEGLKRGGEKINANFTELYDAFEALAAALLTAQDKLAAIRNPIAASWSGAGVDITTPTDDVSRPSMVAGTISKVWVLTEGGPGSCRIDIRRRAYASYPPGPADSIVAAAKPTIVSGIKYQDITLTGWSKTISADDVLTFHLEETSAFTAISVFLEITLS